MSVAVEAFYHEQTNTFSYVVQDPGTNKAAIIDPVLDYDHSAGRSGTASADRLIEFVTSRGLTLEWILETHAHADHLTSAPYVKTRLAGRIGIGEGIRGIQETFKNLFNLKNFETDGIQFDHLFRDEEVFRIGELQARALHTPGHTNDSMTYLIDDAAFIGDTLFAPDYGTARVDFPGGDARTLYRSIQRLFALPARTRLFLCHDYQPTDRPPEHVHDVTQQRASNVHVCDGVSEDQFAEMREARDKTLTMPNLIIPAVQVNIRGGQWPEPEDNGTVYLKVPVNTLGRRTHK